MEPKIPRILAKSATNCYYIVPDQDVARDTLSIPSESHLVRPGAGDIRERGRNTLYGPVNGEYGAPTPSLIHLELLSIGFVP